MDSKYLMELADLCGASRWSSSSIDAWIFTLEDLQNLVAAVIEKQKEQP